MKKITKPMVLLFVCTTLLCSCDSYMGIVEETTQLFINAINSQDKATIYSIYPNAKNVENIIFPEKIEEGKIAIKKTDNNEYIVSIANSKQQKLVFRAKGEKGVELINTYSVLELDSASIELAVKSGVPLKQISDLDNASLMKEDGDFIAYLNDTYSDQISGTLTDEQATYSWNRAYGGSVSVTQPIRNIGAVPIKGSEYNVEFFFYSPNGTNASKKIVEPGVDLEPNEATTMYLFPGSAYIKSCENHDFSWKVSFVYKNMSSIQRLLKYVKFTGKEYDDYKKSESENKNNKKEDTNSYAWLSERLATESDISGKSKEDIRIMRNTIFAMHGYIFKTSDMKEYFENQSWYKAEKADVSSELSTIENENIQFLKAHE